MDTAFAQRFATDWIAAWNSHDLDRLLSHYTDDFEMSSPRIVEYADEPSGTLTGKEKVRVYWSVGLTRNPNLHFTLLGVHVGANSIAILYRNETNNTVSEVLFFNASGLAHRAAAHYAPATK